MKTITLDRNVLVARMQATVGRVSYKLGAKPRVNAKPGTFSQSDCSGYVRWLLYAASKGAVNILPGSWHQQQWCIREGFKKTSYELHAQCKDGRLRIAFINPATNKVGHVWLILNGQTIEAYGGHGAGRRAWDTPTLRRQVDACYVLTEPMG